MINKLLVPVRGILKSNTHTVNITTRGVTFDNKPALKTIFRSEENNNMFKRIFLGFADGSDIYFGVYKMKEKNFQ